MYNWKFTISYLGTYFYGFQKQPKKRTVQGVLEDILEKLFQEKIKSYGAGRTDAGVHALNQVVSFKTSKNWDLEKLKFAINSLLPQDIVLKSIERVDDDFHARYSAKNKTYIYIVYNNQEFSPFLKDFVWWIKKTLDRNILLRASELLLGEHDFINFCILENKKNTLIKIEESFWFFQNNYLIFYITAPYFLRKMVRFLVGSMIELGLKRKTLEEFSLYLNNKFPQRFAPCAPPQGLYLYKINY